jgi:hypothetical protein
MSQTPMSFLTSIEMFGMNVKQLVVSWYKRKMKNKIITSNNQVCVCVQQNILNAEFKEDKIFLDEVETL